METAPAANTAKRERPIRVVVAKPGLDGHDQGAKVVVRALMDAGMEVIYTGLRQTPEAIAEIALQEDVDVIALSSMAGSHLAFCRRLKPLLEQAGLDDKLWMIGGNLPAQDHDALRALGFRGVFATGSRLDDIVGYIEGNVMSGAGPSQAANYAPSGGVGAHQ
jgi:methylmalonyl-CoA mutase C-terminal domain/subunit